MFLLSAIIRAYTVLTPKPIKELFQGESIMKEVPIFIASSIVEFETERLQIGQYLKVINDVHKRDGVRLEWQRPETDSHALYNGGSQLRFDEEIRESKFFFLLIGKKLGEATNHEFDIALDQYQKTQRPLIIPYFLDVRASVDVLNFQERIRKELCIGKQYVDVYENLGIILFNLHIELIRNGAFDIDEKAPREGIIVVDTKSIPDLINQKRDRIEDLKAKSPTVEVMVELTEAFEEVHRLEDKLEDSDRTEGSTMLVVKDPPLDTREEMKRWLEESSFEDAKKAKNTVQFEESNVQEEIDPEEAAHKALIGIQNLIRAHRKEIAAFDAESDARENDAPETVEEISRSYTEIQRLVQEYMVEPDVLLDYMEFLYQQHRYTDGIDVGKWLNNFYQLKGPGDAVFAHLKYNLALFYNSINNLELATKFNREALEIYGRLSDSEQDAYLSDMANAYNNLANTLIKSSETEQAKKYHLMALEIRKRLIQMDTEAFDSDLAMTYYNLGLLEREQKNYDDARRYFAEALFIFEKPTHISRQKKYVEYCRSALLYLGGL